LAEYGGECYCDDKIENNQGQAYDGSAGCDMGCRYVLITETCKNLSFSFWNITRNADLFAAEISARHVEEQAT